MDILQDVASGLCLGLDQSHRSNLKRASQICTGFTRTSTTLKIGYAEESKNMMYRVIKVILTLYLCINLIISTSSNEDVCVSNGTNECLASSENNMGEIQSVSMMSEIYQTMALSMFIYELVAI